MHQLSTHPSRRRALAGVSIVALCACSQTPRTDPKVKTVEPVQLTQSRESLPVYRARPASPIEANAQFVRTDTSTWTWKRARNKASGEPPKDDSQPPSTEVDAECARWFAEKFAAQQADVKLAGRRVEVQDGSWILKFNISLDGIPTTHECEFWIRAGEITQARCEIYKYEEIGGSRKRLMESAEAVAAARKFADSKTDSAWKKYIISKIGNPRLLWVPMPDRDLAHLGDGDLETPMWAMDDSSQLLVNAHTGEPWLVH